jgi:hypothetical protein
MILSVYPSVNEDQVKSILQKKQNTIWAKKILARFGQDF